MDGSTDRGRHGKEWQFTNAARTPFDLEVTREIHLQKAHHFAKLFGADAQSALAGGNLKMVGFQTINTITNRGAAMDRAKGLVSIWSLGQFPAAPRTYIIVPYKSGDAAELGPVVNSDYFGESKKGGLRMWNKLVYDRGGLPMHAGAKIVPTPKGERTMLIVGLSGLGR